MVTIIDRTLTTLNMDRIQSQDLNHFCELLFICGITKIELSHDSVSRLKSPSLAENSSLWINGNTCFLTRVNQGFEMGNWKLEPNELMEKSIPISQIKNIKNKKIRVVGLEALITMDYAAIFQELLNSGAHTLDLCPSNKKYCATAIALEWVIFGGTSVSCCFTNQHDCAPLEEVLMALKLGNVSSFNGDLSVLDPLRKLYEKMTGVQISKTKAVIGEDIFKVESGIHVDGILKNPITYEPFNPQTVGNQREIVLGKHSGQQSILYKLKEQNISQTCANAILKQIKERCSQLGRNISDSELHTLAREVENDCKTKIYC